MSPSDVIRLIFQQITDRQMKAGDKVIIPVSWGQRTSHGLKAALRQYWKVTPVIEGTKNIRTLSVTVVPAMLATTS